jgi:hypothetical protein
MKTKYLLFLAGLLLAGCVTRTDTVNQPPPGPSLAEVQTMMQAHVGDSVIISQIQRSHTRYHLTADQIIRLKKAGVSDAVINALIDTANVPTSQTSQDQYYDYYPYDYDDPWPWLWWGWYPGHNYGGGYY